MQQRDKTGISCNKIWHFQNPSKRGHKCFAANSFVNIEIFRTNTPSFSQVWLFLHPHWVCRVMLHNTPQLSFCSICPFIHLGACANWKFSHYQCLLNFTEIESVLQSLQKTNQFKASINLNSWHLQLLSISLGIFDCLQSLMCGVRRALRLLCSGQGVRISTNEALAWVCGANQELRVVQISQD